MQRIIFSIFIIILSGILLMGCAPKTQFSFSISGKIDNLDKPIIVLTKIENLQQKTTSFIDSIEVNKHGEFYADYYLEPHVYQLIIDSKTVQLAIGNNQKVEIKGTTVDDIVITGSPDTQLLNDYEKFRKSSLKRLVGSVRNKIKAQLKANAMASEIIALRQLEIENYQKHLDELMVFIKEQMGTSVAIYNTSLRWNSEHIVTLKELIAKFEVRHSDIELTRKLKNQLLLLERTSKGGLITDIVLPDVSQELLSLNSVKGKYTLIDFWASWCPPCRTESLLLNNLYNRYKSEGFEIFGISLDSKRDRWEHAIKKDNRLWPNVSSLEGLKSNIAIEFGVSALPKNFLIDTQGKIIDSNIHGEALNEKITALFSD